MPPPAQPPELTHNHDSGSDRIRYWRATKGRREGGNLKWGTQAVHAFAVRPLPNHPLEGDGARAR